MSQSNDAKVFSQSKADAFAERLVSALNDGALCLMTSIGHRTGLFDAMRDLPPSTSENIAKKAGLNERYVREWLGAMVTGRVVELDADGTRYRLPPEHAAFLTRQAAADNLAVFAQYVSVMGDVEDDIVECFKKGGGVPYDRFPRFHAVMAEDSGQSVLSSLESHILPLIPGLTTKLENGIQMLDAGCGRGKILNRLAELYPESRFTGVDLSKEAIDFARREGNAKGLTNTEFLEADLSNFHDTAPRDKFDFITTFDAVHDQASPLNLLKGIHLSLKKDGVYLMQDIKGSSYVSKNLDHPIGPFLYTVSCLHCMTVSLAQGGEGLGAMWGEEKTHEYLEKAGFGSVQKNELAHDIQNNWYVARK
jgi:2-polyprenyl-3-methyl-5-hydroxy-6-metoxy-1,4-benzoquinol methylase